MTLCNLEKSVPDWVIEYPETLAIFQELGIDYCCGGKSLEFACLEQGCDIKTVMSKLLSGIEASRSSGHSSPYCKRDLNSAAFVRSRWSVE